MSSNFDKTIYLHHYLLFYPGNPTYNLNLRDSKIIVIGTDPRQTKNTSVI